MRHSMRVNRSSHFLVGCAAMSIALVACGSSKKSTDGESADATGNVQSSLSVDTKTFCGVAARSVAEAPLGDDLAARATSLRKVAAEMPTEVKSALEISADAMDKMAEASSLDPTGKSLAVLVQEFAADDALSKAQEVIDGVVAEKCAADQGGK